MESGDAAVTMATAMEMLLAEATVKAPDVPLRELVELRGQICAERDVLIARALALGEKETDMDAGALDRQVERQLESLRREFADEIPASRVTAAGEAYFDRLRADARIPDFIPVLVYRFTREELVRAGSEELLVGEDERDFVPIESRAGGSSSTW